MKYLIFNILIVWASSVWAQQSSCFSKLNEVQEEYTKCLTASCQSSNNFGKPTLGACVSDWVAKDRAAFANNLSSNLPVQCTSNASCSNQKGCFAINDYDELGDDALENLISNVARDAQGNISAVNEVGEVCNSSLECASLNCDVKAHRCLPRQGCRFGLESDASVAAGVACDSGLEKFQGKCVTGFQVDQQYTKMFENLYGGENSTCNINLSNEDQKLLNEVSLNLRAFEILFLTGSERYPDLMMMRKQMKDLVQGLSSQRSEHVRDFHRKIEIVMKDYAVLLNLDKKSTAKITFRGKETTHKALASSLSDGKVFLELQKDFEYARAAYEKKIGELYLSFATEATKYNYTYPGKEGYAYPKTFNNLLEDYMKLDGDQRYVTFGTYRDKTEKTGIANWRANKLFNAYVTKFKVSSAGGIRSSFPTFSDVDELKKLINNDVLKSAWSAQDDSAYLFDMIIPKEIATKSSFRWWNCRDNAFLCLHFNDEKTTKLFQEWQEAWNVNSKNHLKTILADTTTTTPDFKKYLMADPELHISNYCLNPDGTDSGVDCSQFEGQIKKLGDRVFSQAYLYGSNGWKKKYWSYWGGRKSQKDDEKALINNKKYDVYALNGPRGQYLSFIHQRFLIAGELYKLLAQRRVNLFDPQYLADKASCIQGTVFQSNTGLDGTSTAGTSTGGVTNIPDLPNFFGGFIGEAFKGGTISSPGNGSTSGSSTSSATSTSTSDSSNGGLVFGVSNAGTSSTLSPSGIVTGATASGSRYGISDSLVAPSNAQNIKTNTSSAIAPTANGASTNFKFNDSGSGKSINFNSTRDSTNANFSGLSASEQGVILSQAERVQPDSDELFDRVSHAYIKSGYKRVLTPTRTPAGQVNDGEKTKQNNSLINKLKSF